VRNTAIVQDVYNRVKRDKQFVSDAIADAAEKFGMSEDMVVKLWKRYRWARLQRLFG
jgi:hypothetical protein